MYIYTHTHVDIPAGTAYFVRNKSTGSADARRPEGYRVSYTAGPAKVVETPQDSVGKEGDAADPPRWILFVLLCLFLITLVEL